MSPTFLPLFQIEDLRAKLEDEQNFGHYLLGSLQEMRLKYNDTAKKGEYFGQ